MISPILNRKQNIHLETIKYDNVSAIDIAESLAAPFIALKMMPISLFSIKLNNKVKN